MLSVDLVALAVLAFVPAETTMKEVPASKLDPVNYLHLIWAGGWAGWCSGTAHILD